MGSSGVATGQRLYLYQQLAPGFACGNAASADVVLWSVLSLISLLGGIGLMMAAFGRWRLLGWQGRDQQRLSFVEPSTVALTPAQRAAAYFFFVMALLFFSNHFWEARCNITGLSSVISSAST